jgi:hypothetical protein
MSKLEEFMVSTPKVMMELMTFQTKEDLEDLKSTSFKTCITELKQ